MHILFTRPFDDCHELMLRFRSLGHMVSHIPVISIQKIIYENLDFSYFIDLANVWGVDYSDVLDNTGKIRSSTGISLDYLSPIGPLSFSWSLPISKESSDKTETFRFNLGTTF